MSTRLLWCLLGVAACLVGILVYSLELDVEHTRAQLSEVDPSRSDEADGHVQDSDFKEPVYISWDRGPSTDPVKRPEKGLGTAETRGAHSKKTKRPSERFLVRGHLIDQRTREPVSDANVVLQCNGISETVIAHEDGLYSSRNAFAAGLLTATVYVEGEQVAYYQRTLQQSLQMWTLELPIGPTYDIDLGRIGLAAANPSSWEGRVVETTVPEGLAGIISVRGNDLHMTSPDPKSPDRRWPWREVTRVGRLRYPTIEYEPNEHYSLFLELRNQVAGRKARVPVLSTLGINKIVDLSAPEVLATLLGSVTETTTSRVALLASSGEDDGAPLWFETVAETGGFSFVDVPIGEWRLVAYAPNREPNETLVEVVPGINRVEPIQLRSTGKSGTLWLTFRDPQDEYSKPGRTYVRLRLKEAPHYGPTWLGITGSSYDENLVRIVSFDNLPVADFEIVSLGRQRPPSWRPKALEVSVPCQGDGFVETIPAGETLAYGFRVTTQDGEETHDYHALFGPEGCMTGEFGTTQRKRWFLLPDADITWGVWKDGYAPAFGTSEEFVDGEGRLARVHLVLGWGVELVFRAMISSPMSEDVHSEPLRWQRTAWEGAMAYPPIAGVTVQADGHTLGVSNNAGITRIQLESKPDALDLHSQDWRLVSVARWRSNSYVLWMERR